MSSNRVTPSLSTLHILALTFLLLTALLTTACGGVDGGASGEDSSAAGVQTRSPEQEVKALRKAHGDSDPRTLQAMARWIRSATGSGDLESGSAIFDRLLGLDLRSSPVLAWGKPPISLARHLGGLGELEAARRRIATQLEEHTEILDDFQLFALDVDRAVARLDLALGNEAEGIARLERILEKRRQAAGTPGAWVQIAERDLQQARRQGPGDSEALRPVAAQPTAAQPPPDDSPAAILAEAFSGRFADAGAAERLAEMGLAGAAGLGELFSGREENWARSFGQRAGRWSSSVAADQHAHFDNILELSTRSGLEVAERSRLYGSGDLSLVTRILRHGSPEQQNALVPEQVRRFQAPLSDDPPTSGAEIQAVIFQLQALTRALDRLPQDDPRFASLHNERERLHGDRRDLLNQAWNAHDVASMPTYLWELQPHLDPSLVMLYFVVGSDHTDLLVVPPTGDVKKHRAPIGRTALAEDLDRLLEQTTGLQRGVAEIEDFDQPDALSRAAAERRLYDLLIAPAAADIERAERVLIVPDGPLYRLPFASLRRPLDEDKEQFFVQWRPLYFAPSAAAYRAFILRRARQPGEPLAGRLTAFANPAYERSGSAGQKQPLPVAVRSAADRGFDGELVPLPGSEMEAQQIGRMFERGSRNASIHLGAGATEELAKEQAGEADILHFAVHGFVNEMQPEHSFLALSLADFHAEGPDARDPDNGILEGWEIVDQMALDAELVALSACETAVGRERGGEGPVSLSRAFLAAGARSVLASLWRVDDAATAELMISFYEHLLAGKAKDEALRQAQLDLLQNSDFRDPYYWAGFQLTGDWL
ncbi:MAG: CHAT domain-containing protein [Acidobacteriota bacterium]